MDSEISILRSHGLSPEPENKKPALPDATVASQRYREILGRFNQLVVRIDSYSGQITGPDVGAAVLRLIDEAMRLALDVRHHAAGLGNYPTCFITFDSGVAYFRDIAAVANQAYQSRISELENLHPAFWTANGVPKYKLIDLDAHNKHGGHLKSLHVAQSMTDFQTRFIKEEKRGTSKTKLSSLIAQTAQTVVSRAIHLAKKQLQQAADGQKIYININELTAIGYAKERSSPPKLTKSGQLVVVKSSLHPDGFLIITAELD